MMIVCEYTFDSDCGVQSNEDELYKVDNVV